MRFVRLHVIRDSKWQSIVEGVRKAENRRCVDLLHNLGVTLEEGADRRAGNRRMQYRAQQTKAIAVKVLQTAIKLVREPHG
jgi:hypothetical protein